MLAKFLSPRHDVWPLTCSNAKLILKKRIVHDIWQILMADRKTSSWTGQKENLENEESLYILPTLTL